MHVRWTFQRLIFNGLLCESNFSDASQSKHDYLYYLQHSGLASRCEKPKIEQEYEWPAPAVTSNHTKYHQTTCKWIVFALPTNNDNSPKVKIREFALDEKSAHFWVNRVTFYRDQCR